MGRTLRVGTLALILCAPLTLTGCFVLMKKVPWTMSSLDFNGGRPHQVTVKAALPEACRRLIEKAQARGLEVTEKKCAGEKGRVVFKSAVADRNVTVSSQHYDSRGNAAGVSQINISAMTFSRYYADLEQSGGQTDIKMVGLLVWNTYQSCPDLVSQRFEPCRKAPVRVFRWMEPAEGVMAQWKVDISGRLEADAIGGIFAALD